MLRSLGFNSHTSFLRTLSCGIFLAALLLSFVSLAQEGHAPKTAEDLPPGGMREKAVTSCTECHEARIIVQQRLSKAAWAKEVDKMVKWGAIVDAADRDALIDYLSSNFNPDKAAYEPPKTARQKSR